MRLRGGGLRQMPGTMIRSMHKPRMNLKMLWRISVTTTIEAEDAVGEMLKVIFDCPTCSYSDFESGVGHVYAFLRSPIASDARQRIRQGLNRIRDCKIEIGPARISIARMRQKDWAESWKRHFKPIEFGQSLLIKPGWGKKKPRKNQAVVVLDPGLSFGTGQHPTTAFCLSEIEKNSPRRSVGLNGFPKGTHSFLDIGAGSGILALSAAKLGYRPVCAMDVDANAVRAAQANAKRNRVRIQIIRRNVLELPMRPKRRYFFICANLISGLLVEQRERIAAQLRRGGILVLAGILEAEFSAVRQGYEELGLKMVSTESEKGWQSGSFCFE